MTIEEVEKLEKIVWYLEADYYTAYPSRNFELEKFICDKVLYYIKLGVTGKDLIPKCVKKLFHSEDWHIGNGTSKIGDGQDRWYNKTLEEATKKSEEKFL
jgi:hypothetical protein